jgi:ABC-type uncharacterized transport system substrate-binding protein
MKKLGLTIIAALFILTSYIGAHPHIFIEGKASFTFNKEGLTSINVKWMFDEMFSTMILTDYDKNKDKKFSADEIKKIQDESFSNLKEYQYFTFIRVNKKTFKVETVTDFNVSMSGGNMVYSFSVPCHVKAVADNKEIILAYFDESYYIDLSFSENNPVSFYNNESFITKFEIKENDDYSPMENMVFAQELIMKFKKEMVE